MARSKKHLYPIEDQLLSEQFKSLNHPARHRILRTLIQQGTSCVTDIAKHHPLSKESISKHLTTLYRQHLVTYRERFPYSFYTIDRENVLKTLHQLINCCTEFQNIINQIPPHEHQHLPPADQ